MSERLESPAHDEIEEHARPFHALYEHWERNQWSLFDLDFTVDAESYARLDEESEVARLLPPFVTAAPDYEVQLVLSTQLSDEHRHLQAVLRIYDEVFGVRGFAEAQALSASNSDPVSARLYSEFATYVERLDPRGGSSLRLLVPRRDRRLPPARRGRDRAYGAEPRRRPVRALRQLPRPAPGPAQRRA